MEKTISVRRTTITFSIWDLGGQREFVNMLPLVCNDAVAILFMFDLSRKSTLNSVKEWYRQARGFNKVCKPLSSDLSPFILCTQTAIPFLIGTKFDQFATFPRDEQEEITKQVRPLLLRPCIGLVVAHRPNASPEPCTHRSFSAQLLPPSMCKRSSKLYLRKRLISNA